MVEETKKRKALRHPKHDYNSAGVYFITICTRDRKPLLSRVVGTGVPDCHRIELTEYGRIADQYINQLDDFYSHLSVENYVIMPNHIHLLLWIKDDGNIADKGQSRTPVPTNVVRANNICSQFVSTFKRFCNKEYGENIWQARFHDHVVRNYADCEEHMNYINENPLQWHLDELYAE